MSLRNYIPLNFQILLIELFFKRVINKKISEISLNVAIKRFINKYFVFFIKICGLKISFQINVIYVSEWHYEEGCTCDSCELKYIYFLI